MSETKTRKTLEEVCPIFRTMLLDSNKITKLYLLGICGLHTADEGDWPDVDTPLERYMAQKSGILYYLDDDTECTDEEIISLRLQNNGMPSIKMTAEDELVCKSILYCSMSDAEKNKFAYLKQSVKENFYKYYELKHAIERYDTRDTKNEEENVFINQARTCGWFDNVPQADEAEKEFVKNKQSKKEKEKAERKGKKILGIFDRNDPFGTALLVFMKENNIDPDEVLNDKEIADAKGDVESLAKLYGKMMEAKNKKNSKDKKTEDSESVKKKVFDKSSIENIMGAAGFSEDMIDKLTDDKYSDVRDVIVESSIDMIGSFVKAAIIDNPDKFKKSIENIDTDVVIDTSIDGFNGLRDVIEIIFEAIKDLKEADDMSDSLDVIGETVKKLKENIKVFTSSKFLKFLKKIPVRNGKKSESAIETAPAAFMKAPFVENDDDKPEFCKDGSLPITFEKSQSGKPDFILQANQVVPAGNGIAKKNDITSYVENNIRAENPWVEELAKIAANNGVSVSINSIPGVIVKEDGSKEICPFGIQVKSTVNGTFNYMKSFSIDFGHFIDNRYKVMFNANSSGFFVFDKCESAYGCFKDPKNKILDDVFFNKVFSMGYSGLNDADNKQFRIINSNMTQLNRVIEAITLPTNLPKKERQAIKDSAFKIMRYIKTIQKDNGVEFGRFRVIDFNRDALSYVLSNEGTILFGEKNISPRCRISVCVDRDEKGNIKTDENGKALTSFSIDLFDNVYDLSKFKYPDGSPAIISREDQKKNSNNEENIVDMEPVEETTIADDEGETPEIIQQ